MDARRTGNDVSVRLNYEEAFVLSNLLHRWQQANSLHEPSLFEDKAEQIVLWDLCASLEPTIDEVFSDDYSDRLSESRRGVRGSD